MGTSDVITDLLLVAFPIPIVLKSHMAAKRKLSLVLLFSLSIILIAITIYRVIEVVHRHSDQQFRSLLASLEILAAAAVSNALVLGSFVRDRGVKKPRYRLGSVGGNSSLDRAGTNTRRRTLTVQTWGSDADLAGECGMRMATDLEKQQSELAKPRPAPIALPPASHSKPSTPSVVQSNWNSPIENKEMRERLGADLSANAERLCPSPGGTGVVTPRRTSFFDVGGLLGHGETSPGKRRALEKATPEISPAPLPPNAVHALSPNTSALEMSRRGSNAFMTDMGGQCLSVRNFSRPTSPTFPSPQRMHTSQRSSDPPVLKQHSYSNDEDTWSKEPPSSHLRDVGGLLD